MSPSISQKRRRKILFRFLASFIASLVAILLAEFAVRQAGLGYPILYEPDEFCGSRLRADTAGWWMREGHAYVRINSLGLRGEETARQKPKDVFRIAVVGDSFMEALQVDLKNTFCKRLERFLNEQATDGKVYEVLNFGVSGYGATQQLLTLRHHVLPFSPDAVLLAFFPGNDIRNNLRQLELDQSRPYFVRDGESYRLDRSFLNSTAYVTASSNYESVKSAIVNRSNLLQILMHTKQTWGNERLSVIDPNDANAATSALRDSVADSLYAYGLFKKKSEREAWATTEWALSQIANEARLQAIPFFMLTVSTPAQLWPSAKLRDMVFRAESIEEPFYAEQRLESLCRDLNVDFLPLASRLQTHVDKSGEWLHGFSNSGIGFGHWNPTGHRLAAEIAGTWLKTKLHALPEKK
jgi:hypothetical protein